ncbi:MAG: hypothetical protein OEV64_15690 [Desulfobulbaceae bacterium]|nr:hypothetical protein [Desulfobulbaceae bacterium]
MDPGIINSIVTFVVGSVALVIYKLTKRSEKKNAATIVVMDIRHAEQVVLSILEKGIVDRTLKNILSENNWAKYKHLFASEFSYDDFAAFNRFFDSCVEIADAKKRMNEVFYASLNAKTSIAQQKILDISDISSQEGQAEKKKIIEAINTEDFVFEPNEPKERILRSLQLMGRLSNTVAFEKLKKLAGNV